MWCVGAAQVKERGTIASPLAEMALWGQLSRPCIASLMSPQQRHGAMDDFAGDGWPTLYCDDADRLFAAGRFTQQTAEVSVAALTKLTAAATSSTPAASTASTAVTLSSSSSSSSSPSSSSSVTRVDVESIAWIEPAECVDEYPALADLLQRLHALPFELNRDADLKLGAPVSSSTLLRRIEPGAVVLSRADSGPLSSARDTGFKVSVTYFFSRRRSSTSSSGVSGTGSAVSAPDGTVSTASAGLVATAAVAEGAGAASAAAAGSSADTPSSACGQVVVLTGPGGAASVVHPTTDRLLLHRSRQVEFGVTPATPSSRSGGDHPLYALTVYLHGADDAFGT